MILIDNDFDLNVYMILMKKKMMMMIIYCIKTMMILRERKRERVRDAIHFVLNIFENIT